MRYYTLEEATAALPRVRAQVERIRDLIAQASPPTTAASGNGDAPSPNGQGSGAGMEAELRGLLEDLQREGIVVRDPGRGLIDFPAQSPTGREYLLCWLVGEDAIEWWHWPDAGFAGRTPLSRPPD